MGYRTALLLFLLMFLASCSESKDRMVQNPYNDNGLNDRITDLENRVSSLEQSRTSMIATINAIQVTLNLLAASDTTSNATLINLQDELDTQQSEVNLLSTQLVALQHNVNIVEIVDPCGDGPGFDEVLFKTSSGKYVASFSDNAQGVNTRFSVLTPGSFQTTDGTNCHFSLSASGVLSW